jgi:hypothetical protein
MWRVRQMNWVCKMSISLKSFTRYLVFAMACTLRWTMLYWRQDGIVLGRTAGVGTCRQVRPPDRFCIVQPSCDPSSGRNQGKRCVFFFFLRFLQTSSLAYTLLQVCIYYIICLHSIMIEHTVPCQPSPRPGSQHVRTNTHS